jgi:hypothetical protein
LAEQKKTKPTEEAKPPALPKPVETKEQLIERLTKDFSTHVDVQGAAAKYEEHLSKTGRNWKNGRFVALVTELHQKARFASTRERTSSVLLSAW